MALTNAGICNMTTAICSGPQTGEPGTRRSRRRRRSRRARGNQQHNKHTKHTQTRPFAPHLSLAGRTGPRIMQLPVDQVPIDQNRQTRSGLNPTLTAKSPPPSPHPPRFRAGLIQVSKSCHHITPPCRSVLPGQIAQQFAIGSPLRSCGRTPCPRYASDVAGPA